MCLSSNQFSKVQRKASKLVPELRDLPHEGLQAVEVTTLHKGESET